MAASRPPTRNSDSRVMACRTVWQTSHRSFPVRRCAATHRKPAPGVARTQRKCGSGSVLHVTGVPVNLTPWPGWSILAVSGESRRSPSQGASMTGLRVSRRTAVLTLMVLGASLWTGCSDGSPDALTDPLAQRQLGLDRQDIHSVLAVHRRRSEELLRIPGVVGTAVGYLPNGKLGLRVLLARHGVTGVPSVLDGIPVAAQVTGMFVAFSDPTKRQRPAPMGFSVGHPAITAGSIGARVADGSGNLYILSNNHVLANSNDATIAVPDMTNLDNTTPLDDGYGVPSSAIFGDANSDGLFDNVTALLGLNVQKYGRTTKLTHGTITGINGTVDVCYEVFFGFCIKSARFVDQLIIEPGTFSGGGDSGSLIVTDDASKSPVGLLFAGSSTQTIANRIDLVLSNFSVHIDGGATAAVTDIAITSVNAPASVTQGSTANVVVTVRNVGNQPVTTDFNVSLKDVTDNVAIGAGQLVHGLGLGASATVPFSWTTSTSTSTGNHTLAGSHDLTDDKPANNQASTNVMVNAPPGPNTMHVGDLDAVTSSSGNRWSATVEITVHDENHNLLNGATVVGHWSQLGTNSTTCTTGDLGGNGTCIVTFPSLRRSVTSVNMTVVRITLAGRTYVRADNHDPDGDSNGTTIKVNRP